MAKKKKDDAPKRGRKKKQWPIKTLLQAIELDSCNPYVASLAEYVGCSYNTMKRVVDENPELRAAMELRKTEIIEKAESTVMELLDSDDQKVRANTAKWVLSVRNENYMDKSKVEIEGNVDTNITINIRKDDESNLKDLLDD